MGFRVYDNEQKKWISKNIYLNPDGELYLIKQSAFRVIKTPFAALDSERYVCHKDIGLSDRNGIEIFEGDYVKAVVGKIDENDENSEDLIEIGLVVYAAELSAYVILCVNSDVWYSLGSGVVEYIEVVGNVFDGYEK